MFHRFSFFKYTFCRIIFFCIFVFKMEVDGMSSDSEGLTVSSSSSPTSAITTLNNNNTNKAQTVAAK